MKLKYTLVFTIISFFIATAGFAQSYSDQEGGIDIEKIITAVKEHRLKEENISDEISKMQIICIKQYIQNLEKQKRESKLTSKSSIQNAETATPQELAKDRAALIAFYNSTNGDNWINTQQGKGAWPINDPNAVVTSWDPATNTGWYGITIDSSGRVTDIYFGSNTSSEGNNLTGTLTPQISQLQNLSVLDLQYNKISGNIPVELAQLQNLIALHLADNNLSGGIPVELGQLSTIRSIDLSRNPLTGSIPTEILMPNLTFLSLCYNQLSGNIPLEIRNLTNIEYLQLNGNKLTGSIPIEIGNLKKLEWLGLPANQLSGTLPAELGQLSAAKVLYFDQNKITGPIPPEIKYLSNLQSFWAEVNLLNGSLPAEFGQLKKVTSIKLSENSFTGEIPIEIGDMTSLSQFEIAFNKLTGNVPDVLANLTKLGILVLNSNQLSGKIPNLTALPLNTFRFNGNGFRFVDFLDEHPIYRSKLRYTYSNYNYSRQALVDTERTISKDTGDSVTLTMYEDNRYTSSDNYQWYRGNTDNYTDSRPGELIPGATSRSYTINNITYKNGGDYICVSKNPNITNSGYMETDLILVKNTIHLNVNVTCIPVVGTIKTSPENISANQDINISFETTATDLTYKWTLYDLDNTTVLSTATTNTVQKYYPIPGTYKINLVVTEDNKCTTSFDKIITIAPQVCPTVTGTIKTGANNLLVNAVSLFYFDSPTYFSSYEWTFYDLNNNIEETVYGNYRIKSFSAPGSYRVRLTVIDQNRCTTNIDKTVTVTQPPACPSQETGTIFSGENDTVYINTDNEFYFNTNTDQDLHYNWTIYNPDNTIYNTFIGIDNYISGLNFTTSGTYKITLKITDMSGCTATFSRNFNVIYNCYTYGMIKDRDYPFSNEGLQPVIPNTNLTLFYNSFTSDTANKEYSWSFLSPNGDIIKTGNGENFDVTPTTIGDYKVKVQLTDTVTGCVNNFDAILPCVNECEMSNSERGGKITINGDYDTSEEAIFIELNQPIDVGLNRTYYSDTGRPLSFEWSLIDSNSQILNTGTNTLFPIVLTSPGFYKVVLKVTDAFNGCSTVVTRAFANQMNNSCTQTNERSSQVKELARDLAKKLLQRTASGETDAQINNSNVIDGFITLKSFITNSPKDKIYNYKTTRDRYNAISSVNFSFSPNRESDFYISIRDGLYTNGVTPDYLDYLIDKAVYVDISQFVSSNETLASCWVYDQQNRSVAKSVLDPKDCRYSSEIKNINFCPPACNEVTGTLKQSTQEVFTNRNTNFSLETTATDLTYKWTFYNLGNEGITVYTTNSVDKKYTQQGSYDIKLEVTDSNGCITTFNKTVIVTANTNCTAPTGTIKTSTPEVFVGTNTNFSLETTATDLSYKWTFTQNSESTIFTTKTVDYTYISPGTNNVTLEVIDSNGCKFTFQKLISLETGSDLCDNVTQFGRAFVQVGSDADLYRAAKININQTTNVTFPIQSYGSAFDFEYKWSLLNENDQLVDSGTSLNFPIIITSGGFYRVVLDLKENTSGCVHQFSRSIVGLIPNSCAQTNPQSSIVKGLVVNLVKNLISRAMLGENDAQINSSAITAEFNALKPYITSGLKDKIYNFASTRNLNGEFTGVDFSFSPDRTSDIHISIPHSLRYQEDMPIEDLLSLIESKIYINLNQYSSSNQYLASCYTQQSTGKSLLKPIDCQFGSEIKFIDFCPNECDPLLGVIKLNTEKPVLNTATNFSLETTATGLTYNWTFYNADNSIKETQTTATASQTYTVAGTYKVVLIATDANNCPTTFTKNIVITAPSCIVATGTIKTVSPNIFVGTTANFFFDTTATNLTYQWTLYGTVNGSTTTFTTNTANMYYNAPGNYNVKLLVTDTNGCTNTFRTTAVVTAKPPCVAILGEIKTANPIVSTNQNTTFSFETTATNLRYNWTFYSLNNTPLLVTTDSNPTLMYPYANDYRVSLTVTDDNDCSTTIEKTISVVRGCPVISGSANIPLTVSTGQIIPFEYTTSYTGMGYKWTFYNLDNSIRSTSTSNKINKAYYSPGNYRVTLELSDLFNYGCTTFIDKIVTVTGQCGISGTIQSNPGDSGISLDQYVYFWFESEAIDLQYKWTVTTPDNVSSQYSTDKYAPYYFQSGSGTYKIAVEVSDGNGCKLNLEKIYNLEYDCSRNAGYITGQIYNNSHKYYYSDDVLINAPNKFTFWSNNSNNEGLPTTWELTAADGSPITTFTGSEFIFTPTTLDSLNLKLTITDQYGCPHYFSKKLNVVSLCQYHQDEIDGDINFDEEYSYKVAFIDANQTKDLIFRSYDENNTKVYTYHWNLYDLDGTLVSTGDQQKFPITLANAGYYKVTLDIIDPDTNCPVQFTKKIGCVIYNSCTETNQKSQVVKELYLELMRSLILRVLLGETDSQINASKATPEFIALQPYITNGVKDKIYNFKSTINEEGSFSGFDFSFSPDRQSDVHYYTRWSLYYDSWDMENTMSRINQTLYLALNQYVSSDQSLISCYVDYGGKMAGKNVNKLDPGDCVHELGIQYIDFCPAEDCIPITGTLKSPPVLGIQTGAKKGQLKPASRK